MRDPEVTRWSGRGDCGTRRSYRSPGQGPQGLGGSVRGGNGGGRWLATSRPLQGLGKGRRGEGRGEIGRAHV